MCIQTIWLWYTHINCIGIWCMLMCRHNTFQNDTYTQSCWSSPPLLLLETSIKHFRKIRGGLGERPWQCCYHWRHWWQHWDVGSPTCLTCLPWTIHRFPNKSTGGGRRSSTLAAALEQDDDKRKWVRHDCRGMKWRPKNWYLTATESTEPDNWFPQALAEIVMSNIPSLLVVLGFLNHLAGWFK